MTKNKKTLQHPESEKWKSKGKKKEIPNCRERKKEVMMVMIVMTLMMIKRKDGAPSSRSLRIDYQESIIDCNRRRRWLRLIWCLGARSQSDRFISEGALGGREWGGGGQLFFFLFVFLFSFLLGFFFFFSSNEFLFSFSFGSSWGSFDFSCWFFFGINLNKSSDGGVLRPEKTCN